MTTVVPDVGLGQDVDDYASAFDVATYTITGGSTTIPLGEDPVIIEATGAGAIPTVSEWGTIVMALLLVTAASLVFLRKRPTSGACIRTG